jgi:hypothetical protein
VRVSGPDTSAWIATLPAWLLGCTVMCAGLVGVCRRFERARPAGAGSAQTAAIGILCAAVGLFTVSRVGLDGLVDGRPFVSAASLLLVAAGYRLLGGRIRARACASVQR